MHTYRTPNTQQDISAVESNQETTFTSLKKFVICFFLIVTLLLAPAAAVPEFEAQETDTLWKCTNPNPHVCKQVVISVPVNDIILPPAQGRDLKLRAAQKKLAESFAEYSGEISNTGDVFFSNSPVVTSLHLQEGVTGNVFLQTKLETSRPKFCHVYNVFELSLENYPVGSETIVRYTLPLSEIEENGYNPIDITLCIYEDNIWQKLSTIYSMDERNAYFESVTTSLGTFAIVTDDGAVDDDSLSVRISSSGIALPVTLDVSPTCFVTHPVSYTATV